MSRIPCFVTVWKDPGIICRAMDSLCVHRDSLAIHVVENPSDQSPQIRAYLRSLLDQRAVQTCYLFQENILGNALETILRNHFWPTNPLVMLTDGDLDCAPALWDEQERAMRNDPRLYCCASHLCADNLPLRQFPEGAAWIPPTLQRREWCDVGWTGMQRVLMRAEYLQQWLSEPHDDVLVDTQLHRHSRRLKQYWGRTRVNMARHLTWDVMDDPDHPYFRDKMSALAADARMWERKRSCPYTIWANSGE